MINAVIYGYGNIGRATREAIEAAADFLLAGVVSSSLQPGELGDTPVVRDIAQLPKPDVVILCAPSEKTPDLAERLLLAGYRTVDSFDMHQHIPAAGKAGGRIGPGFRVFLQTGFTQFRFPAQLFFLLFRLLFYFTGLLPVFLPDGFTGFAGFLIDGVQNRI